MPIAMETYDRIERAVEALSGGLDAKVLGGGTLIMRAINYGDQSFGRVVHVTDPSLLRIDTDGRRIRIGARVTMAQILASPVVDFLAPAARMIGGPAIRNMATVGGNLFAPHPYGDLATMLLALDCKVQIAGAGARNEVSLEELLQGRDRGRQPLVTSVTIERPAPGELRYHKVARVKPKGIAIMTLAARLPTSAGRVSGARVAFGAMASTPVRAAPVERALEGKSLDEAGIAQAVAVAGEGLDAPTDALASGWYRKQVLPVHLKRLLLDPSKVAK